MGFRGKLASCLVGLAVMASCLVVPVIAQDTVTVTITALAGSIELFNQSETNGRWVAAREGQKIGSGWELRTGAASRVELLLPRNSLVILRENSVLYVDWLLLNGGACLRTDVGGMLVDIRNSLSPGSEFRVKTPSALAVVRGTKFGVVNLRGGAAAFYGYRGKVVVTNELGSVLLQPDMTVDVKSGMAPEPPRASGPDAQAFLAVAGGEAQNAGVNGDVLARLGQLDRELGEADKDLARCESSWRRYARDDKAPRLVYLHAEAESLRHNVDRCGAEFQGLLGSTDAGSMWSRPTATAQPDGAATEYVGRLQGQLNNLYGRFERLQELAAPVLAGNDKLRLSVDSLAQETQGALWQLKDTDGDGVSDVDETALNLDPVRSQAGTGFIRLDGPPDGAQLSYPADDLLEFRYTPLASDVVKRYRLVLECGSHEWQRTNVGPVTQVRLGSLFGMQGIFAQVAPDEGPLLLEWYVVAELDVDQLLQHVSAPPPRCEGLSGPALASVTRRIFVSTPVQSAAVILDLTNLDGSRPHIGDRLLVEGRITKVVSLGQWRVDVACDPALLDFAAGRKAGLASASPVYFGENENGVIVVRGTAASDTKGLDGEGALFQLEFTAKEPGRLQVLVQSIDLRDVTGRMIEANPGHKVELDVLPARTPARGIRRSGWPVGRAKN
jgi:hypothetical protein